MQLCVGIFAGAIPRLVQTRVRKAISGYGTFAAAANNCVGTGKSFKQSMQRLGNSSRIIADAHLHTPIRRSESLPTATQVNFANDLDVLFGEIVRILR
jgi:hypothetical protein